MTRTLSRDNFGTLRALRPALMTAIKVGLTLSIILTSWVIFANRMPFLERYADLRNAVAAAAFLAVAIMPLIRYRNSAIRLLASGAIGWGIASLCYLVLSVYFARLQDRMSAFHIFVMGAAVYGLASILVWLGCLLKTARVHHISMQPATRRRGH